MRRSAILALAGAAAVLGGCVYNPYTGLYEPCCNYYGNPYGYRYPAPYYGSPGYQQGPYGGQAPAYQYQQSPYGGQPPAYQYQQGPETSQPPPAPGIPGASANPAGRGKLAERFAAANVTHDGRLTREQAQAGMPMVARNFDTIDLERKGYVTLPEIRTFAAERRSGQLHAGG